MPLEYVQSQKNALKTKKKKIECLLSTVFVRTNTT